MELALEDIEERVLDVLRAKAGGERDITAQTLIVGETGLDSVHVMDVVLELEDHFDLTIPLDRLAEVRTAADLAAMVCALRGEHA